MKKGNETPEEKELRTKINRVLHKQNFIKNYIRPLQRHKQMLQINHVHKISQEELRKTLLENINYLKELQSENKWAAIEDGGILQTIPIVIVNRENEIRDIELDLGKREREEEILLEEIKLLEEEIELRKQEVPYKDISDEEIRKYVG